ncbi:uncharacterized protein A1O9_09356 [Exophiala aquamarina CBS 119918]|uniref:Ribosomal RNA-processing protein 15 n=1 Tax=Exophiala aquamarina CBS 119918 TaxID=1182545 RepID=A0A072P6K5_9EURO|nr:uncharacterized protein A1O9_09356 [Exophiala aquamarina CBS 119918]KEF54913.1 hypothetical protein A1O9_09356 [Exophiala aquamarina CBS 119918]
MAPLSQKKRKLQDGMRGKTDRPKKRFRKQKAYHSSSEDSDDPENGFAAVNLDESGDETPQKAAVKKPQKSLKTKQLDEQSPASESGNENEQESRADAMAQADAEEGEDEADEEDEEEVSTTRRKSTTKRNDPEAFSTSIAKILSTKLSQAARKDPVLSRSRDAAETSTSLANERLERKAKAKLRAEKREELERGRVRDVLGLSSGQAGEVAEEEKKLRKIAQRGVVKLFNAVRAAQVQGEQAAKEERKKGTIGVENRQEKVNEISKQGFLDLIGGRGNNASAATPVQS